MRKDEQRLYDAMARNLPLDGRTWLRRVEDVVAPGFPDVVVFSTRLGVVLVELKVVPRPARPTTLLLNKSQMPVEQRAFHIKAWQHTAHGCGQRRGGHTCVLVQLRAPTTTRPARIVQLRATKPLVPFIVVPGWACAELNELTWTKAGALWGASGWNTAGGVWSRLREVLA